MKNSIYLKSMVLFLLVLVFIFAGAIPQALALRAPDKVKAKTKASIQPFYPGQKQIAKEEGSLELPTLGQIPEAPGAYSKNISRIDLGGPFKTTEEVIKAVKDYISNNPDILGGLSLDGLKLSYAASYKSNTWVQFKQQTLDDKLEIDGTYVNFSVKNFADRCVVMGVEIKLYPGVSQLLQKTPQAADIATLRNKAKQALGLSTTATLVKERKIVRYYGEWLRLYEANYKGNYYTAVVNTGNLDKKWLRDDRLFYSFLGRVRGRGVLFDPITTGSNLDTLDQQDLKVNATGGITTYTDTTGNFSFSSLNPSPTVTAALLGRWADANSEIPPDLSFSGTARPGIPLDILFNPTGAGEYPTAQVNGYYHTTNIHNWVISRISALTGINSMVPVNVNIDVNPIFNCNAYYDPGPKTINFLRAGYGCINAAYDTIIYHEYGHFVDDMAGGITSHGLSEGWGDVMAAFLTGQPLNGEGLFGHDTYVRTAHNNYQYWPYDEVHNQGQAWAGFAWNLRESQGAPLAESLIIPAILANSADIPSAVVDVLYIDDDDANISNGTPHLEAIMAAANQHDIPVALESIAFIESPSSGHMFSNQEVAITGTASGDYFQSYQLFYYEGLKPGGQWIPIAGAITTPVENGVLGIVNLPVGLYQIKLEVTWQGGEVFKHIVFPISAEPGLIQVTNTPDIDEYYPVVSGNNIVFSMGDAALYLHDTPTGGEKAIDGVSFTQSIFGDKIVWADQNDYNIYLYDIPSDTRYLISNNVEYQGSADISGNLIVWEDYRNLDASIYLCEYDPQTHSCTGGNRQISTVPACSMYPAISGNKIVWQAGHENTYDIYLCEYDSQTHTCAGGEQWIASAPYIVGHPRVSNLGIAWSDYDNNSGFWQIYFYDFYTRTTRLITNSSFDNFDPRISGSKIDWMVDRCMYPDIMCGAGWTWNSDVFFYDILKDTSQQITSDLRDQYLPVISGNRIVWQDARNSQSDWNKWDIYMYEIPYDPPPVGCFLRGTPILMADGSLKSIEKVKVGDELIAFDEKTAKFKKDKVSKFFKHKSNKYLIINDRLKITANHPVYSSGKWVNIGSLKIGDVLLNLKGKPELITSIKEVKQSAKVYNLEVGRYHTYIAGGIVVHNKVKVQYCSPFNDGGQQE